MVKLYYISLQFHHYQNLDDLMRGFVVNELAFEQVCSDYKLEPETMYRGFEEVQYFGAFIRGAYALQMGNEEPPADEVKMTVENYCQFIEDMAKQWE